MSILIRKQKTALTKLRTNNDVFHYGKDENSFLYHLLEKYTLS